jgi:hypothetical protein
VLALATPKAVAADGQMDVDVDEQMLSAVAAGDAAGVASALAAGASVHATEGGCLASYGMYVRYNIAMCCFQCGSCFILCVPSAVVPRQPHGTQQQMHSGH